MDDGASPPSAGINSKKIQLLTFPMEPEVTTELLPTPNETSYGSQRDPDTISQYSTASQSIRRVNSGEDASRDASKGKQTCLVVLKYILGFAFFLVVLVCSAASKITLVSLTSKLAAATNRSLHRNDDDNADDNSQSVRLYWYLFFVISLPSVLTFVRSSAVGVLGKTRKTFPWPTRKATFFGLFFSALEVTAITVVVYVILPTLPPDISILILNGVFVVQILLDIYYTRSYCLGSISSSTQNQASAKKYLLRTVLKAWDWIGKVLESKLIKCLALLLQIGGIVALACYIGFRMRTYTAIAFPFTLLVLSFVWSNRTQEYIAKTWNTPDAEYNTGRYKSSFINSAFRILLYPFVSYAVFRSMYTIDPWCLDNSCSRIELVSPELAQLITQILTSFLGYVFAWISCVMMLNWCGLALPLFLSTPISLVWYYTSLYIQKEHHPVFPHFELNDIFDKMYPAAPCIAATLWIGQILAMLYYIFSKTNIILAQDNEMFLTPHYDGIFLEQHTILNRQTKKNKTEQRPYNKFLSYQPLLRKPRQIFICSTMYRENDTEMKQMLTSIYRVARYCEYRKSKGLGVDNYESHIFFDGSINGTQLQPFALQLISLLEKTLKVKLSGCHKIETPYGYQLKWYLGMDLGMTFTIHLKDKNKVKPKKRWSQVMYMNYVINYRIQEDKLNAEDTFILTTDADIEFTAESAVVLLDMLASNKRVGAVSARTHPKGSGPLYWYQVFDYAIGHWFMKPAEHILGCVLCSPGCFSVFRCSALNQVISEYATDVTSASEFLTKDMGEDRWLCTLLIKKGWRLEYCAISEDQTYVPDSFSEFYKQRRRWIPSTLANLSQLISEAGAITRNNDTISIPFILFQALMVFSTAVSPATVILIVSTGLQSAYHLNSVATIVVLILVSVLYGIICLCASQKTQIDVAKLLTFIFAVIMAIVIAGIFRDTIYDIFPDPKLTFVGPPDCSLFPHTINDTKDYDNCVKNARYLGSLNSTTSEVFKLPVSMSTIYLGVFAATFTIAAILHLPEWSCLIHSIWYLLALPSGYLLLLIYSAANLDSQTWGTREESSGQDEGLIGWIKYIIMGCKRMYSNCCRKPESNKTARQEELLTDEDSPSSSDAEAAAEPSVTIRYQSMDAETRKWLTDLECDEYIRKFEEHGYTNKHYIAAMSKSDFEIIGIDKRGFRLRLEKAAKKLPSLPIDIDIPNGVSEWLKDLEMKEYTELFHNEGYKTEEDIENLKDLSDAELRGIGVHKRAHLQRLRAALNCLFYPLPIELEKRKTKAVIENTINLTLKDKEANFWQCLIQKTLKPVTLRFTPVDDLQRSLRSMRNSTLAIVLLINLIWIILLHTLSFDRLAIFSFDPRVFQLLFIAVYGFIIVIQFLAMICHRCVTLIHYLGRVKGEELIATDHEEEFVNMTLR